MRPFAPESEQPLQIFDTEARLFENVRKRRPFDGSMGRDDDLQGLRRKALPKSNVTAPLAHDNPTVTA